MRLTTSRGSPGDSRPASCGFAKFMAKEASGRVSSAGAGGGALPLLLPAGSPLPLSPPRPRRGVGGRPGSARGGSRLLRVCPGPSHGNGAGSAAANPARTAGLPRPLKRAADREPRRARPGQRLSSAGSGRAVSVRGATLLPLCRPGKAGGGLPGGGGPPRRGHPRPQHGPARRRRRPGAGRWG